MKKEYLIILVILLVAGVGFFALKGNKRNNSSQEVVQETSEARSGESVEENTVIYTELGFSPNNLTVEKGTTVTFVNNSGKPMWVASDPHPVHTDHSAFDQLSGGKEYSFTFGDPGSYRYHNHLVPTDTGVAIVE